jgi:DMSO/TMAO reductase YedYZ molybdopterin-dependent catalytic subunit
LPARLVDWGLAALVAALVATGVLMLFAGSTSDAWVYAVHDTVGVAIGVLLVLKLRRVWSRISTVARWERGSVVGVLGAAAAIAALSCGLLWSDGATFNLAGYSLLSWHDALGVLLAIAVAVHMWIRAKRLRRRDLAHRRQFLVASTVAAGAFVAWRVQRPLDALLGLSGAKRRFTGSYEAASFAGNAFNPRPIEAPSYRLRVRGLVARELTLPLADLAASDELIATLDCTGGFYSTQRWAGVRLGQILDLADPEPHARHVSIAAVTGYRWSFALADARELLLATRVGGEPLSQQHGAPVRLVVPGARGYQWVKWVERVDVREHPDYGAPASTVWSSFTQTGRGSA